MTKNIQVLHHKCYSCHDRNRSVETVLTGTNVYDTLEKSLSDYRR